MRALRSILVLVASTFTAASAAAQCPVPIDGPFVSVVPADGATGAALDGALRLTYDPSMLPALATATCSAITADDIYVQQAGSGTRVSGTLVPWADNCAGVAVIAWRPTEPLAPYQQYLVDVAFQEPWAAAPQTWSSSFTTGDALLPPLSATSEIVATLEVTRVIKQVSCMQPYVCGGGGGCMWVEETVLRVRVDGLQSLQGGQSDSGYAVVVALTADVQATFSGPGEADLSGLTTAYQRQVLAYVQPGIPVTLMVEIPATNEPHVPCVSINVWDAAGTALQPAVTCFESMRAQDYILGVGGAGGAGGQGGGAGEGSGGTSGSGGDTAGSGGETVGTGGESVGAGGESVGAGGESVGSGGETAGSGGQTVGSGGETVGSGGEIVGSGGQAVGTGGGTGGSGDASAGTGPSGGSTGQGTGESGASASSSMDSGYGVASDDSSGDDGGCGCRAAASGRQPGPWLLWPGLVLLLIRLRRRCGPRSRPD